MYIRIWQFRPHPGKLEQFLAAYGPEGDWVQLFRTAGGFLGTELLHSVAEPDFYLTIDRWDDSRSWEEFRATQQRAYATLDEKCDSLTLEEREIGTFQTPTA